MAKPQGSQEIGDDDILQPEGVIADDEELGAAEAPDGAEAYLGPNRVAQPVPPTKPLPMPEVGAGETFVNRAANMLPLGRVLTDAAVAGQMALAPKLGRVLPDSLARNLLGVTPEPGAKLTPEAAQQLLAMGISEEKPYEPDLLDLYRGLRDNRRARTEIGSAENPVAGTAGAATGFGLSVLAPIPAAKVGSGFWGSVGSGAVNGAINGALGGLTDGGADTAGGDILGTLRDGVVGGAGGSLFGGVLGGVAYPAGKFVEALSKGILKPTPSAKYLRDKGVDLTTGQMAPDSVLGQIEEVSTSVGGVGPAIMDQRIAGKRSWQDAVMNEALPPGMSPPDPTLPVDERLAELYEGFVPAYAPAKGAQIIPQTSAGVPLIPPKSAPSAPNSVPGIFDEAVNDPNVLISAAERADVRGFLQNQLTIATQNAKGGKVSSDAILAMRHNIRRELTQALRAEDFKQARLLRNAEEQLTDVLETSLPDDAFNALRAADSQYARYKPLEAAVAAAGDMPSGFTPTHLSNAIKANMGDKGAYARGAGGTMREMAAAGKQVFDTRSAPTGARIMGMGPMQWIGAPMSYAANLKPIQKALLGEQAWQKGLGELSSAVGGTLNRFPYEAVGGEALDQLGMGSSVADRSRTPEAERFRQQVVANPAAFGPYGERLQQAAAQGPDQLTMQDFLLSSDPNYIRLRREAAQAGQNQGE